jgi:alpha-L-fucosidase
MNLVAGKPAVADKAAPGHDGAMAVDGDKKTYWSLPNGVVSGSLEVELGSSVAMNRLLVQEEISLGQRVERFKLEAWDGQAWRECASGTTIGYKRLLSFPTVTASKVRLTILDARDVPAISEFGLFKASPKEE